MPNRMPPSRGYDQSTNLLSRSNLQNPLRHFLADYASRDRVVFFDDFAGDAINLDSYAVAASGGGTAFAYSATATTLTGATVVLGTTTATAAATVTLITPPVWYGAANASFEARLKINTTADMFIEAGFVDAAPGSNAPAVTDIDTPTLVATNAALLTIDTTQTHNLFAFATIGDDTGQTVATTLFTAATQGVTAPTADTFFTVKVQLLTDPDETGKTKAYCWVNGKLVASHHTDLDGYVKGTLGLAGWICVGSRTNAARLGTIDYIRMSQDRGATE